MFIWVFLYDVTRTNFWSTQYFWGMSGQPKLSFLHCTISQIIMQSMTICWAPIMCQALNAEKTLWRGDICLPFIEFTFSWCLSTKVNKQTRFQILLRTVKISTGDIIGKDWKWGGQQAGGTVAPQTSQVKSLHVEEQTGDSMAGA